MSFKSIKYEWWHLRSVGSLKALKVSYIALALVPIVVENRLLSWIGGDKSVLFCTFFGSLFLALANLLYDTMCPTVIKRFESPNDLYHKMLEIRKLSMESYHGDDFNASKEHCFNKYNTDSKAHPKIRLVCVSLFISSAVLLGYVILNRAVRVVIESFA